MGRINRAHARCYEEADLASLGLNICHAEQLYTDAVLVLMLVLDASTRVAAAARSGLIDLRFAPRAVRFFAFVLRAWLFSFLSALNINGP